MSGSLRGLGVGRLADDVAEVGTDGPSQLDELEVASRNVLVVGLERGAERRDDRDERCVVVARRAVELREGRADDDGGDADAVHWCVVFVGEGLGEEFKLSF